jgi:hypothetical protein
MLHFSSNETQKKAEICNSHICAPRCCIAAGIGTPVSGAAQETTHRGLEGATEIRSALRQYFEIDFDDAAKLPQVRLLDQ